MFISLLLMGAKNRVRGFLPRLTNPRYMLYNQINRDNINLYALLIDGNSFETWLSYQINLRCFLRVTKLWVSFLQGEGGGGGLFFCVCVVTGYVIANTWPRLVIFFFFLIFLKYIRGEGWWWHGDSARCLKISINYFPLDSRFVIL